MQTVAQMRKVANILCAVFCCALIFGATQFLETSVAPRVRAQSNRVVASPAPAKIVEAFLKATGGKKANTAVRDATFEWTVNVLSASSQSATAQVSSTESPSTGVVNRADGNASVAGRARLQTLAPSSARLDVITDEGELNTAANARIAWQRQSSGSDNTTSGSVTDGNATSGGVNVTAARNATSTNGSLRTLTDVEASAARLAAALQAGRLIDFKKENIRARTVAGTAQVGSEAAYIVEFTARDGGRVQYFFGTQSKLLLQTTDESRGINMRFAGYRAASDVAATTTSATSKSSSSSSRVLVPHRIEMSGRDLWRGATLVFTLERASFNTGLQPSVFDPPVDKGFDIAQLLRDVARNQAQVDERVRNYTFTQTTTERELNERGEVKKQTVKVFEVFPVPGRRPVFKLISENGVALSGERAAKETRRAGEELEAAERDADKRKEQDEARRLERQRRREAERQKSGATNSSNSNDEEADSRQFVGILLRACELFAPRRERFRERDVVVFDFRPRANFRPSNREESIVNKLTGIVWIDPQDKQVMRFEARLASSYKIGGGLLVSVKPGSALIVEQTRLQEGVWLPRLAQFNASIKLFLFAGGEFNVTQEWSDYKRFNTSAEDIKYDSTPQN